MYGYGYSLYNRTLFLGGGDTPPSNSVAPVISGTQTVGQTLTSTTGTWIGIPAPTYSYQWYRGASLISGATSSTYVLVQADAGNTTAIKCVVTATNSKGSANADSNILTGILDADASAFITAAAITDATQQTAINTLVIAMKADGTWTKMKAIYPFVGGTATTHKWNLKDPRDLDAAFRLVFNGGWTHSSTGATPNGTNGYANTYYNPSLAGQLNSAHVSYYSRTNTNRGDCFLGCNDALGRHYLGQGNSFAAVNSTLEGNYNPSSYAGFHLMKREDLTQTKQLYNGNVNTTSVIVTTARPNINMFLSARNSAGNPLNYNVLQTAFSSIGDGLLDAEAAALYSRVQNFQLALSRNV